MRYGTNGTRLHGRDSHWNLEALGIVPEAQGRVLGTRLLVHGLARADQDGLDCCLTS
jgi:ribosomal protein S18 acetylase RimI-like enzyme